MKIHVGIDIGKNGSIVVIDNDNITAHPIPLIGKKETVLDLHGIKTIIKGFDPKNTHVVLEDVHAIFGVAASATFTFGGVAYALEMACVAFDIPYTKVAPKKWQEQMFAGVPMLYKPPKKSDKPNHKPKLVKDNKAMALVAAKRLFPNIKLTFGERATVPHDGLVDGLLIAEFSRRNF